ncbi:hypothetical protein FDP41_002730 [Naegleria fowleri]|uniref:Penicillin amidase n=1 Tax=Naegleria fowleri TaxID=5763 RepID=A0A6A5BXY1_NAEFO|nr:uncharacterized protein FDP41_002730 [Naegleria fowleri]KAF0978215.1 hypothetical protein FDP41_002730 [Naegleria fowleri]
MSSQFKAVANASREVGRDLLQQVGSQINLLSNNIAGSGVPLDFKTTDLKDLVGPSDDNLIRISEHDEEDEVYDSEDDAIFKQVEHNNNFLSFENNDDDAVEESNRRTSITTMMAGQWETLAPLSDTEMNTSNASNTANNDNVTLTTTTSATTPSSRTGKTRRTYREETIDIDEEGSSSQQQLPQYVSLRTHQPNEIDPSSNTNTATVDAPITKTYEPSLPPSSTEKPSSVSSIRKAWLIPVSIHEAMAKHQDEDDVEHPPQDQKALLLDVNEDGSTTKKRRRKIRWYHTKCFIIGSAILLTFIAILTIILSFLIFYKHNHLLFVCGSVEFIVVSLFEATILICCSIVAFKLNEWYQQHHGEAASDEDLKLKYSDNPARDKLILKFQNATVLVSICLLILLTLVYVGVFSGLIYAGYLTLASFSGNETYTSLRSRVTIEKEKASQVLHIHGKTDYDVFFAQGVMTAKARLFQMEVLRRMGQGTLSALVGEDALEIDVWSRTLGLLRSAKKNLMYMDERTNKTLHAFFDGVNSYINSNPKLPPEYRLFYKKKTIHVFEPVDALLFWKLNSLDYSTNAFMEQMRFSALRRNFTVPEVMEFFPVYPRNWPSQFKASDLNLTSMSDEQIEYLYDRHNNNDGAYIPRTNTKPVEDEEGDNEPEEENGLKSQYRTSASDLFSQILSKLELKQPMIYKSIQSVFNKKQYESYFASNAWAVSGNKTKSGKPMLANDPHMTLTSPLPFLMFHLVSDESGLNVIGSAYPLVPGVFVGRTTNTSWGITSSGSDVQDLYVMHETSESTYIVNGTEMRYDIFQEEIHLDNTQRVTLFVKEGIYGPVVNPLYKLESAEPLAMKWVGLAKDDTTLNAVIGAMYQNSWWGFYNTMSSFVSPPMNYIYADKENNICSQVVGRIPIRKYGHSGQFPVSGNGTYDYLGYIPYQDLPFVCNPKDRHYVIAANAMNEPPGYPYYLGGDVATKYRFERIEELLRAKTNSSVMNTTDMSDIQLDTFSKLFVDFKPFISAMKNHSRILSFDQEVWRKKLEQWNGYLTVGSKEASLFEMFYTKLWDLTKADLDVENSNAIYILNALKKSGNCTKSQNQTCLAFATEAFKQTVIDLKIFSRSDVIPSWGVGIHSTTYFHPIFHNQFVGCFCDKRHYVSGGTDSINFSRVTDRAGLDSSHGVGYRQIISMSDADGDRFITPLGQSGNWLDSTYSNNLQIFAEGRYHRLNRKGYKVDTTLVLSSV